MVRIRDYIFYNSDYETYIKKGFRAGKVFSRLKSWLWGIEERLARALGTEDDNPPAWEHTHGYAREVEENIGTNPLNYNLSECDLFGRHLPKHIIYNVKFPANQSTGNFSDVDLDPLDIISDERMREGISYPDPADDVAATQGVYGISYLTSRGTIKVVIELDVISSNSSFTIYIGDDSFIVPASTDNLATISVTRDVYPSSDWNTYINIRKSSSDTNTDDLEVWAIRVYEITNYGQDTGSGFRADINAAGDPV